MTYRQTEGEKAITIQIVQQLFHFEDHRFCCPDWYCAATAADCAFASSFAQFLLGHFLSKSFAFLGGGVLFKTANLFSIVLHNSVKSFTRTMSCTSFSQSPPEGKRQQLLSWVRGPLGWTAAKNI